MSIEARNISKSFGGFRALKNVSMKVPTGDMVALLGPSGSGKTTFLRIIAGLDFADTGTVLFDGVDTTDRRAKERAVGFVFQHYALFRHMTVFDNVAFGLTVKPRSVRPSKEQVRDKVNQLLKLVQLDWLATRYPSQLSGGQRQRVALARALAVEPRVLLLDEPFGSLDAKVRQELRRWLRRLHDEIHVTSIFVTHDQEEALEVADRVVVMNQGQVEQEGVPDEVYNHPVNAFVYDFLGNLNLFHGRVVDGKTHLVEPVTDGRPHAEAVESLIFVRPHLLHIERETNHGPQLPARVTHINCAGPVVKVDLVSPSGQEIHAQISHERFEELGLQKGDSVFVSPRDMTVFPDPQRVAR